MTTPGGSQPKARASYWAIYPDGLGREQARANYGTNGGTPLTRADTIPPASDTVLVSKTTYAASGEVEEAIDPKGTRTRFTFDHAGRLTKQIEDYGTGTLNRETQLAYTPDNQLRTLTARNSVTTDQVTTWTYGTTLSDSDAASNDWLRYQQLPDGSASDRLEYKYNRLGELKEIKDQLGNVRTLEYDKLGRWQHDRVTMLAGGVDGAVRRITRSYEVRGLLEKLTSYDNATVGSGSVVNEVQYAFNGFMLLTSEYQSHSGAVNTGTSPKVQYAYADGSSNHARRTSITYPDGKVFDYYYGGIGGANDMFNRVRILKEGLTGLVDYAYLGWQQGIVNANFSGEAGMELTYYTSGGSGEAGDQYTGLDRFGRVIDQRWRKTSDNSDKERIQYGFDRASNRRWRKNAVAVNNHDEYYTYDGLYQVKTLQLGTLNAGKTGITGTIGWEEDWNYDPTGNWRGSSTGYKTIESGTTTLDQNRAHNKANEITNITTTTGTAWPVPIHDAAGNMTKVSQLHSVGSAFDLKYDAWNRLMEVKVTGGSVVATYRYDGANRRVTKLTGSTTRHYYYSDQWQVLEERLNTATTAERRFVWGMRALDDLVLRDRGSERFYVTDDYFNITGLLDTSGAVQERYGYSGFGWPRYLTLTFGPRSSSSYDWETLFRAYRFDIDTGLYQVRNRYLHARLGRWLNRDPIDYGAGTNLYAYVGNGPMNAVDPFALAAPPTDIAAFIEKYAQEHGGEQPWVGWWDTHQNRAFYGWYPGDDAARYGLVFNPNWARLNAPAPPEGTKPASDGSVIYPTDFMGPLLPGEQRGLSSAQYDALQELLRRERKYGLHKAARMSSITYGDRLLEPFDSSYGRTVPTYAGNMDLDWFTDVNAWSYGGRYTAIPLYAGGKLFWSGIRLATRQQIGTFLPWRDRGERVASIALIEDQTYSDLFTPDFFWRYRPIDVPLPTK